MNYEIYKLIHYFSIALVITSLGALTLHVMNGGTKESNPNRKLVMMTHGIGLLLLIVSGFGMLAKLGIHSFPLWVIGKFIIWLILGGAVALIYKKGSGCCGKKIWWLIPILVAIAAGLALYKPA